MLLREKFGNKVKIVRKVKGLSQQELADKAGTNRAYISGIETGNKNATLDTIEKISKALDVNPAFLLTKGSEHSIFQSAKKYQDSDIVIVTTTKPGFMGTYGSDPDEGIIQEYAGDFKNEVKHDPNVYIHGRLERWMGYDIPWFLAGTVKDQRRQKALAIHPETGQEKECVLIIGQKHAYFVTKDEADDTEMVLDTLATAN